MRNVINDQKDDVFRIRINSEIKNELEEVFAKNGLTLTDAVNVFFQQALNTGGFPFSVTENNAENMKAKALIKLMKELEIGIKSTESYSEEESKKMLNCIQK
ncbi:type II toxin-antitoxin system RelB/DinJ family antitoxin [Eubacterium sp. TM05-53]|jgi:addiction module RelB/DinJ family antitoxin|nr:type II toxin-antitoxin system RelB/DinJ family antitoxin [Eubacterium sp. TM05-53]